MCSRIFVEQIGTQSLNEAEQESKTEGWSHAAAAAAAAVWRYDLPSPGGRGERRGRRLAQATTEGHGSSSMLQGHRARIAVSVNARVVASCSSTQST